MESECQNKLTPQYINDGTICIEEAVRSRSTGVVRVKIGASRLLLPTEMGQIGREIEEMLSAERVECSYDFSNLFNALEEDGGIEALFRDLWCEVAPQLAPILLRSRVERNGAEYLIHVPKRYYLAVSAQTVADFRSMLAEKYAWHAAIHVAADDMLPDDADAVFSVVKRDWGRHPVIAVKERKKKEKKSLPQQDIIYGKEILKVDVTKMCDLTDTSGRVMVKGTIIDIEFFTSKRGNVIITILLTDKTNTVPVKLFPDETVKTRTVSLLEKAKGESCALLVRGHYKFDTFKSEYCVFANDINKYPVELRMDKSEQKRVELHLHTQMSAMDATVKVGEVIALAAKWGHKAIAITDHGVVHAFPEARKAAKKNNIKVIFGCEGYLLPDCRLVNADGNFCAVNLTYIGKGEHGRVFELAAKRFSADGKLIDSFYSAVNPSVPITHSVSELTGLCQEDINGAPQLGEACDKLREFIADDIIATHDENKLRLLKTLLGSSFALKQECLSTRMLMQYLRRDLKKEQLDEPVHNAKNGAEWVAERAIELIKLCREQGVETLPIIDYTVENSAKRRTNHIILLAATQPGLKNLYKLISYSNLDHFYKTPRIPRSLLNLHRKGIILGTACEAGELFRAMINGESEQKLEEIASWYDFLEIQPTGNNEFLIREGLAKDNEDLRNLNRRIVNIADKLGKPIVATGDVHFIEPEDSIYRAILMSSMGFKDANHQPPLYFRTTEDMLEEFSYLGKEKAFEVVVENSNKIADMCEQLRPFLDDKQTYSPELPGAAEELEGLAVNKAHELYGEVLPEIVQARLDKELKSIIGNGYSSLYMVAQKLVSKSLSDGYLVGSRGSVGSSFVAYLAGITEVNSLSAHYRCPNCKYSEFPEIEEDSRCGMDLPPKNCPVCGTELRRDGYEIPFETFLGFKGDKTPDIDLNFSGEYQPVAHKFTEVMFGEGHAFRAGTISAVQDKNVYGFVQHYCEENELNVSEAEKTRLVQGCVGTRKTTGQHPGGIVIVPDDLEIYDFCPVQHPAEKVDAESITTHFDFHALDDKLVKLDILGHDDPTSLRMLQDITGLDPKNIPLQDEETMSIFRTDKVLGISLSGLDCDVGSIGIPEFGTGFVRGMLMDTRPTTMEELVRIAGLSHGTDVWLNNAQDLVRNGTASLMEVICTRDDIMNYLIAHGGEPSLSFKTMESVRKGRGLTEEMEAAMRKNNIPQWYIDSCKKIKYMFPRAHAAAYVMMSFRVAYFKVHYPLEFYAVYFTVRADKFDIELCSGGADAVLGQIKRISSKEKLDQKDMDQITILEVVYEMNLRGIELLPIDIYKSKATRFVIEDGKIRPPFNSIAGLGDNAARCIENGARDATFISREDFIKKTKANSSVVDTLSRLGCLEALPERNQVSMF